MATNRQDPLDPQHLAAPAAIVGLASASWAIAIRQMGGAMDMGGGTALGSFGFFAVAWLSMMAAMMLPGSVPVAVRREVRAVPRFVAEYLAVWGVAGVAVYALYRPHGSHVTAAVVLAAGAYELTPVKRRFRHDCRAPVGSGLRYGLSCLGSCAGLMLALVALDVMSVTWMCVIAVVVAAQKLLPAHRALDVPVALAVVAVGVLMLVAPAAVPGIAPPM
jgi:predicted metal-binding membrane protein